VPAAKRCRHEIIADILEYLAAAGRARLTWVAAHANLPLDRARLLLGEMEFYGLVESSSGGDGSVFYSIGRRGYEYLELWRRIRALVGR
jgi:predicted transcriptional regulator